MIESNPFPRQVNATELPAGLQDRRLGTSALLDAVELTLPDHAELPEGFDFAAAGSIDPFELAALMQTVDIGRNMTARYFTEIHESLLEAGFESIEIGVRAKPDDKLVGYGGLVYDSIGEAEMGNFVVMPPYQGLGIGKAIIDQRLLQADRLGVRRIYIDRVETTNTLKHHYTKRGFIEQKDGTLVRAPIEPVTSVYESLLTR